MKRLLLALMVGLIVLPALAIDETTPPIKIVYVNLEEVLKNYKRYQENKVKADTEVQQLFAARQKELDTLQQQIADLEKQLSGQISEATRTELTTEYQTKVNQALGLKDQAYADADKKREEILRPVVENVNKAIQEMALAENYDFVLDAYKSCLYVKPSTDLDITIRLTDKLNTQY
jgi:outer membrane protein